MIHRYQFVWLNPHGSAKQKRLGDPSPWDGDRAAFLFLTAQAVSCRMAGGQGFEPRLSHPECDVLPIKLSPNVALLLRLLRTSHSLKLLFS